MNDERAVRICVRRGKRCTPRKVYDIIIHIYVCVQREREGRARDNIRNRVPTVCPPPPSSPRDLCARTRREFLFHPYRTTPTRGHTRTRAPRSVSAPFREIDCSIFPRVFLSVSGLLLLFRTERIFFPFVCIHTHTHI